MRERNYNEKAKPMFKGKDDYYLGIELEVEAPDSEKKKRGLDLFKRPRNFYAKHDGSLNHFGWELVTHPIAKNMWLDKSRKLPTNHPVVQTFKLIGDLRTLGYNSHDGGRCGLHVHIDKKAFRGADNGSHFYWFAKLVAGKLFARLSQRKLKEDGFVESSYASQVKPKISWIPVSQWGDKLGKKLLRKAQIECGYGRYRAANPTDHTIEVRIFRGNMREDRIRKGIEAVIAAVEFTRGLSSKDWKKNLDLEFVSYVCLRRTKYPNLVHYLEELRAIKTAEDNAENTLISVA